MIRRGRTVWRRTPDEVARDLGVDESAVLDALVSSASVDQDEELVECERGRFRVVWRREEIDGEWRDRLRAERV